MQRRASPGPCLSEDKLRECVRAALGKRDHQGKTQGAAYVPPQPPTVTDSSPFQFLGFNKDQYFYLPQGQKQVISASTPAPTLSVQCSHSHATILVARTLRQPQQCRPFCRLGRRVFVAL